MLVWVGSNVGKLNCCLACVSILFDLCTSPVLCRRLDHNLLTGTLPKSIGNLDKLIALYVLVMVSWW